MSSLIRPRNPILVTGMPRSGTTWLARLLASAPGTALTGREPMNPRGRQYGLAHTLEGWTRLVTPSRRQSKALRLSYHGLTPLVYSRYGHRQWAALNPRTRLIVKDPFAMLSIPTVHDVTGARALLLFRQPGAALTSYRRMGWSPDVSELRPIIDEFTSVNGPQLGVDSPPKDTNEVALMAWFWNALYGIALYDAGHSSTQITVLAHEDIALGGGEFASGLFQHLGITWEPGISEQLKRDDAQKRADPNALHNFDRNPAIVAHEWESKLGEGERVRLEMSTQAVMGKLRERAFRPTKDLAPGKDESSPGTKKGK